VTSSTPQNTDFSRDIIGRYTCNGLDEALQSTDTSVRPDARPFDVIIVGGGSFAGVLAQHLFTADTAHQHRILVLEAGRLALPEHVQNLPVLGLNPPPPTTTDPGVPRAEVWGLPWLTDVTGGFPGLAYCLGGRSIFFGGWSPRLLPSELAAAFWPNNMVAELTAASHGYFDLAADQIGTSTTNDFIFGDMHEAMRGQLKQGIDNNSVSDAIPLAQLPIHLHNVPAGQEDLFKLEAPLAVQAQPLRAGFFPFNKFSSVPLFIEASRLAQSEAAGDDFKKRLMIIPGCHVTRLVTDGAGNPRRVTAVLTDQGTIPVPDNGVVVLAMGTIESARLALISLPALPTTARMGNNFMAHLRSNLTIRIPREAINGLAGVQELQASALFVKGRHDHADHQFGHFHLQITAAGLSVPSADSEAELFKKIPDVDTFERFKNITDTQIVITIRGIGEMRPGNPNTSVSLSGDLDEFHMPRAMVHIQPSSEDTSLWNSMDTASDDVALVFANGYPYEVLVGKSFVPVDTGQRAETVLPFAWPRRDTLGTTHHEAGTLASGDDPAQSVTNADTRFHEVTNLYAAGPALFPTVGSPNPMLTGTALALRLGDKLAQFTPAAPDPGFTMLFDGTSMSGWSMSTIANQPGKDDPGRFLIVNGALEAVTGSDLGLLWHTTPTPADFVLKLEWRTWRAEDNSGVFVRFPHPMSKNYNNTAFVGSDFGFEVQIDQLGQPDGLDIHKTGAIYSFAGPASIPVNPLGEWNSYEITVQGQQYTVKLNGVTVTDFQFVEGSDTVHPDRGLPTTVGAPRFIGLQTHTGRVAYRNIQIKPL
jgi:choline dehydrogenase-like flavoprotein